MSKEEKQRGAVSRHKSKTGGQALIEGVMMRGVYQTAMAVRTPDQEISVEVWDNGKKGNLPGWIKKTPFVRGIFNMVDSMVIGYRCLMKSAELSGMEEEEGEPGRIERWLEKKFGDRLFRIMTWIGSILGVLLAIGLFLFLPSFLVWGIDRWIPLGGWKGLAEGFIKIVIFVGYLALVGKMKEMRRMFEYHGAEHKTIACYEAGEELTVENIKKQSRFHPRCGTSFLILILILGILIFSVVTWSNPLIRTLIKLALLPVVIGIAYELIKLAGKYDNLFTRVISFPGIQLQHLTTREPDSEEIEVAIASLTPVIPENLEDDVW